MRGKKVLGAAALAATAAVAALIGSMPAMAATTARADAAVVALPLPPGIFQIQAYDGNCVDLHQYNPYTRTAFMNPCDPANVDEQFTYDPLTSQILSISHPGNCLDATEHSVQWLPCDTTKPFQQFQSTAPTYYGWYMVLVGQAPNQNYLNGGYRGLVTSPSPVGYGNDLYFRFPPL
ncbi:MAG: hypothetical protein JO345_35715 [Streptosporangiaceae bacterium]|nr:hypothetical protein [Streptosporangiaceae bacterium]